MPGLFDGEDFKDVQFMTADEKRRVLGAWKRFIRSDFSRGKFTKALYNHLIMHCSFIAHYNIDGFCATYFTTPEGIGRFINQFDEQLGCKSAELGMNYWYVDPDYADLNKAMVDAIKPHLSRIREKCAEGAKKRDIEQAKRLMKKSGITKLEVD